MIPQEISTSLGFRIEILSEEITFKAEMRRASRYEYEQLERKVGGGGRRTHCKQGHRLVKTHLEEHLKAYHGSVEI